MIEDCKWIRAEDKQAWLVEIIPLVQACCDDKVMKNVIGWNCIVEQDVWAKLKKKHSLTMKPANLYKLIRSQFKPCIKKSKDAKIFKKVDEIVAILESPTGPYEDDETLKSLGMSLWHRSMLLAVKTNEMIDITDAAYHVVRIKDKLLQTKQKGKWQFVNVAGNVSVIINPTTYVIDFCDMKMHLHAFNGRIICAKMTIPLRHYYVLGVQEWSWRMTDSMSFFDAFVRLLRMIATHSRSAADKIEGIERNALEILRDVACRAKGE